MSSSVSRLDQMEQQASVLVKRSAAAEESLKDQANRLAELGRECKLRTQATPSREARSLGRSFLSARRPVRRSPARP